MKKLIYILVFGLLFSFKGDVTINEIKKVDQITYRLEFYDNARVYKMNVKKHKFYLLADFKKKSVV